MQQVPSQSNDIRVTEIMTQRNILKKDNKELYVEALSLDISLEDNTVIGDISFVGFLNIIGAAYEDLEIHADLSGHSYHIKTIFNDKGKVKTALSSKIPKSVNNIYFGDGAFIEEEYRGNSYGKKAMNSFIDKYLDEGDAAVIWPFPVSSVDKIVSAPSDFKEILKKIQKTWVSVGFQPLRKDEEEPLYYLVK